MNSLKIVVAHDRCMNTAWFHDDYEGFSKDITACRNIDAKHSMGG